MSGNPPSRHLWVGGLPEEIGESEIKELFAKYGKVEGVKILPQRYPNQGVASFVDFFDVRSAIDAKDAKIVYKGYDLRTNFKTKSTERFDKYEHFAGRKEQPYHEYGKEAPPYSGGGKRSDTSPEEREKEAKDIIKDNEKERARGNNSSVSSSSSSSSSGSSSSDGSSSESEGGGGRGGGKRGRKRNKADLDTLLLKVTNLAHRPERVIQDGLYYEFTRYCSTAVIRMYGEGKDTSAMVKFDSKESAKKAYTEAQGLVLFGNKIKLTPVDREDFPAGGRDIQVVPPGPGTGGIPPVAHMDKPYPTEDVDPQATHSLFVGNIPKNISVYELRDIFQRFGDIVDVEIKKMSGSATYGFVLFYELLSAVSAKQFMDGENIRGNNIRVGFGKGTPSKMLWVDGIDPDIPDASLERTMAKFGKVVRLGIDRPRCSAMVQFDSIEAAKEALSGVKGTFIGNSRRIMTDFANRDARAAFFSRVESGDSVAPPRAFPGPGMYGPGGMGPGPRGMMMPRPGVPMMGMGRGGFPHMAGPPMDMYYYNPYMGEGMGFYGQPPFPRGPPMRGMRRFHRGGRGRGGPVGGGGGGHYEEDDYGDELRAFTRKREKEKEERKRKERRKRHSSSEESGASDSEEDGGSRHRKKSSRDKDKQRRSKKDKNKDDKDAKEVGSEVSSGAEEVSRKEEARLKATQRSRDLREKLKRKNRTREKEGPPSDPEPPHHSDSDNETDLRKTQKEKEKESDRKKDQGREKDRDGEREKEGRAKERVRGGEERERRREKERAREPGREGREDRERKREVGNSKTGERAPIGKRPQPNRVKKTDKKSGRSSSESKTPTSPPPTPLQQKSTSERTTSPPRTPPSPEDTGGGGDGITEQSAREGADAWKGEDMDTLQPPPPRSPPLPVKLERRTVEGKLEKEESTESEETEEKAENQQHKDLEGVPETPESPPPQSQSKKSAHQKLESDLSSGEEFPGSAIVSPGSPRGGSAGREREWKEKGQRKPAREKEGRPVKQRDEQRIEKDAQFQKTKSGTSSQPRTPPSRPSSTMASPPSARWTPDPQPHRSPPSHPPRPHRSPHPAPPPAPPHRSPPPRLSGEESEEGSRKSRKLPRRYQLEEERLQEKQREIKEHRHPSSKPHPPPSTPSPPPAYAAHRRRPMHSPQPPEYERRWRHRGRPYSPGQFGSRRYSRSPPPPGYPPSPPTHGGGGGGRSPYSGSPPPPARPRTPIQRPRDRGGPRHRYDSPPYDMPRGKHSRRGSSPVHHLSPSPPLHRIRSPGPGRRHPRRYSHSPSPQRRSPLRRKERSPSPGSSRSSPRHVDDRERMDSRKYGKKPQAPVYGRSPSPKPKRRDGPPREDYPDAKRRRMDDMRPKSPPGGPPPLKDEPKARVDKSQQPSYPPTGGSSSDRHPPHHAATGKETQPRYTQSSGQGTVHGGATSRSAHYPAAQGKPSSSTASAAGGGSSTSSGVAGGAPPRQPPPPQQQPQQQQQQQQQPTDNLMDLLRRYPVMWQGHLTLKNESAAVQLHFLSGNVQLAKGSLPGSGEGRSPALRIAQRMRLEQTQLEGVQRRMQNDTEHCLLLALPCGRDAGDVRTQTHALKNSLISYLLQKQAAGIINVPGSQTGFVLHIFPPCQFSQTHLSRVAPDLLSSASDNCHLMIVVATM